MEYVTLGNTNLLVSRTSFSAMSLDCPEIENAGDPEEVVCSMVHQSYAAGMNFFDTAHSKTVCEKRLGAALHGIRQNVLLATKTAAQSPRELRSDIHEILSNLETDYIDLLQLEQPLILPEKDGKDGIYNELLNLKEKGLIRHFGVSTENYDIADKAVESGLYETVQFPFNVLSSENVVKLVEKSQEREVGCIAIEPLNGGIVTSLPLAYGYLYQYENVVSEWGARTLEELQQIIYFINHPPVIDEQFKKDVIFNRSLFS
ncbi:MAG: aldo/keto reductase [Treponema sp.]|nr:aldo/keto reductase [Spirochaetia bacterium]MDY4901737.1 aldo/keto reductase [Treponema sp.]